MCLKYQVQMNNWVSWWYEHEGVERPYCPSGSEVAGCRTNCNNNQLTTLPDSQMEVIRNMSVLNISIPLRYISFELFHSLTFSWILKNKNSNFFLVLHARSFFTYLHICGYFTFLSIFLFQKYVPRTIRTYSDLDYIYCVFSSCNIFTDFDLYKINLPFRDVWFFYFENILTLVKDQLSFYSVITNVERNMKLWSTITVWTPQNVINVKVVTKHKSVFFVSWRYLSVFYFMNKFTFYFFFISNLFLRKCFQTFRIMKLLLVYWIMYVITKKAFWHLNAMW